MSLTLGAGNAQFYDFYFHLNLATTFLFTKLVAMGGVTYKQGLSMGLF